MNHYVVRAQSKPINRYFNIKANNLEEVREYINDVNIELHEKCANANLDYMPLEIIDIQHQKFVSKDEEIEE